MRPLWKKLLVVVYFIVLAGYLYWRTRYTLPVDHGLISMVAGVCLLAAELVGFLETTLFYVTVWEIDERKVPELGPYAEYPPVDVYIATYNEPENLIYKTIISCINMAYPDPAKVRIHVCDDGRRTTIGDLCEKLGVNHITRPDNKHAKAGNLNNALAQTHAPLVVTFDADMMPKRQFLMRTIPFFMQGKKIGFVQTPQTFYNPDPFQYNFFSEETLPNEQELFSKKIQMGKNNHNAIIYAGSNTVISRRALEEIGGFAVGTITEDFATGMLIQNEGYETIYLNEELASGLSPENIEDFFNQRIRWGRGVVQTFKKYSPFKQRGLTFTQKMLYFSALLYWYFGVWRFIFLMSPIMFSVFGVVVLQANDFTMMAIWVPMYILSNITFRAMNDNIRTTAWSHIYDTIQFPAIAKGVLLETLGHKMANFKVTPKDTVKRETFIKRFYLVRTQIFILILTILGALNMFRMMVIGGVSPNYFINTFWLVYNAYLLGMAILFAYERPKFRADERVPIHTFAEIRIDDEVIHGKTTDLSEGGVGILSERFYFFNENEGCRIKIYDEDYKTEFQGKIVHIGERDEKQSYAFKLSEIDEENYRQLIFLLYDRPPNLPRKIVLNKDERFTILRLFKFHKKQFIPHHRKAHRIKIQRQMEALYDNRKAHVYVDDSNGYYCNIITDEFMDRFSLSFQPYYDSMPVLLDCRYVKSHRYDKREIHLYEVLNPDQCRKALSRSLQITASGI